MAINHMNLRIRIFISAVLAVCICLTSMVSGTEKEPSSITVLLANSEEGICIRKAEVTIYKIAEFTDYKKHEFQTETQYEKIILKMDFSTTEKSCTRENAKDILHYIKEEKISGGITKKTDENGSADFGNVSSGIYLIEVQENEEYSVDAFLIETPLFENGKYYGKVTASPKVQIKGSDFNSKEEEKITQPEENEEKITQLSDNGEKIPQTGQLKWPVPVLLILGISFIVFGYADSCFKEKKKNENE